MKLTKKARAAIPASKFAGPGRTFPIQDKNHARAAISGASRAENVGNISAHEAAVIKAAARRVLKK
jgi:hypothetical protein